MKKNRTYVLLAILAIAVLAGCSHFTANKKPASRLAMEYAENIIREKKPSPPEAARFYSFVAGSYSDALDESGTLAALNADAKIIGDIYPDKATDSIAVMKKIARGERKWGIIPVIWLEAKSAPLTVAKYEERDRNDAFHTLKWDGKIPTGAEHWVKRDKNPAAPTAGGWNRWVIDESPSIPAPYDFMSAEYKADLARVKDAVVHIDDTKRALVNFWGGVPGTETPSGIWQERLWATTREDGLSDREYAYAQKVLAESLADSFMECWKVKYTYWATRPDMADPTLVTPVMPNPPFPSYPSGHSTISATAASVLSKLFPARTELYWKDAATARDSRLNAGIHFPHDNDQGFALGRMIGDRISSLLRLSPLRGMVSGEVPLVSEPRKSSSIKGNHLYAMRRPEGGAFFVATDAVLNGRAGNGWTLEEVSGDDFWDPRICATMPTVILPGGNILVRETKILPNENGALIGHTQFVFFDRSTGRLTDIIPKTSVFGDLYTDDVGSAFYFANVKGVPVMKSIDPVRAIERIILTSRSLVSTDVIFTCPRGACAHTSTNDVGFNSGEMYPYPLGDRLADENKKHDDEKEFLKKLGNNVVGRKAVEYRSRSGDTYFEVINPLDAYSYSYYAKAGQDYVPVFTSDPSSHAYHYTVGFGG